MKIRSHWLFERLPMLSALVPIVPIITIITPYPHHIYIFIYIVHTIFNLEPNKNLMTMEMSNANTKFPKEKLYAITMKRKEASETE